MSYVCFCKSFVGNYEMFEVNVQMSGSEIFKDFFITCSEVNKIVLFWYESIYRTHFCLYNNEKIYHKLK